jgi:hypothetical protein
MRRDGTESSANEQPSATRHSFLKSRQNRHNHLSSKGLRATSRTTIAGRRDMAWRKLSALSYQPSARPSAPPRREGSD